MQVGLSFRSNFLGQLSVCLGIIYIVFAIFFFTENVLKYTCTFKEVGKRKKRKKYEVLKCCI